MISIRKRLLASTTIAGAVLAAVPVLAQTTQEAPIAPAASNPAPGTQAPASADGDTATSSGDILVTGSRIARPEIESASPVTVVGGAEFKLAGTTRTEDLINALPQVFAGQGGNVSNGATGTATVNLRGLGESRTLVLVNGRRLVPGDPRSPFADINIIPASLVKRVDVLTGGASSVYGADAVSGVVNFVMDTDFEGFRLDGQYSLYNHNNRANDGIRAAQAARGFGSPDGIVTDGGTFDTSVSFGTSFPDDRGHVTAYAGYRNIRAVTQDKRDYSACSLSSATAASVTAGGRAYNCGGSGTSAPGSFYVQSTGNYYNVQGNQFAPGQVLYNFAPTNYYQRPDERYTAGLFANYEISDAFKPYLEFMFMDDRTVAQIAPSGDFFNTGTINCDNPLLSAQQRGIACQNGNQVGQSAIRGPDPDGAGPLPAPIIGYTAPTQFAGGVNGTTFTKGNVYIGRRNVEGGGRQDDLQHTTYRGVIGSKGDFGKGLSYDAYYQYSRVDFAQTYRNDFSISRTKRAIDVVSVNGVPTCRSVVDGTDPACVPYNIFTTGGVTPAALNYLQVPLFSRGQTSEKIANASVTLQGSDYGLVSPFATEGFAINVGGEYREESLNYEVDSNFQSGDGAGQGGATTGVSGGFKVTEAFVEASLPIVQDRPFFQLLSVGGGYRRSHYKTAGNGVSNSFDTDTYKGEVIFAPVRDIRFRASYNRAVRAPNAVELFSAQSIALDGVTDPCALSPGQTTPTATQAQCALTGLPAALYGRFNTNPANQYNGLQGGNPNLTPEVAKSLTAGVVLTPSFLRGFQATVDYFNIKIDNQIGTVGADNILSQCIATGDPQYCSLIRRGASGRLDRADGFVIDTNLNSGKISTRGIDLTLGYTQQLGTIGNVGISLVGTWLDQLITDPVGPSKYDCVKFFGAQCGTPNPEWRHKLRLSYTAPSGPSISGAWRYFSKVRNDDFSSDSDLGGSATSVGRRPGNALLPAQNYFDLALTVPVADTFIFRLGSNNVLDKQPPLNGQSLGNGNTYSQVYDALGRYIYAGVTLDF